MDTAEGGLVTGKRVSGEQRTVTAELAKLQGVREAGCWARPRGRSCGPEEGETVPKLPEISLQN